MTTPDKLTNLLALLPSGTYLAFASIVPITTNNGNCLEAEKIVTGAFVFIFTVLCAFLTFTDSHETEDGTIWYGVLTTKGLWNPFFADSSLPDVIGWTYVGGGTQFILKPSDCYVATLSVISFLTLAMLSSNIIDCYYEDINRTVAMAVPLPVNFFVGLALSFAPPARHRVGFSLGKTTTLEASTVPENS